MGFSEAELVAFFSQYAHQPMLVYSTLILFMYASSFGLPIPEEVVLVSVGLIAYAGMQTQNSEIAINPYTLAAVATFAVFSSDLVVYTLGRFFGGRFMNSNLGKRAIPAGARMKVDAWVAKYGIYAPAVFRFTPGIRFPGHLMCGALKLPLGKFIAVDGVAILVSVPTQIIAVAFYGGTILRYFKEIKVVALVALVGVIVYWTWKYFRYRAADEAASK